MADVIDDTGTIADCVLAKARFCMARAAQLHQLGKSREMPDRTFQTSPTRCDGCAHVAAALSVAGSITVADANIGASE
jgi:hypothetical protein